MASTESRKNEPELSAEHDPKLRSCGKYFTCDDGNYELLRESTLPVVKYAV